MQSINHNDNLQQFSENWHQPKLNLKMQMQVNRSMWKNNIYKNQNTNSGCKINKNNNNVTTM